MASFDKREKGFESKFALDQELTFKANARRAKLVGLWAADLMGLSGDRADEYAKSLVVADFEEVGDEDVFRKLRKDLDTAGAGDNISDHQIRREMEEKLAVAREQIMEQKSS